MCWSFKEYVAWEVFTVSKTSTSGEKLNREEQKREESQRGRQALWPCDRSFKATLKRCGDLREKEWQKERDGWMESLSTRKDKGRRIMTWPRSVVKEVFSISRYQEEVMMWERKEENSIVPCFWKRWGFDSASPLIGWCLKCLPKIHRHYRPRFNWAVALRQYLSVMKEVSIYEPLCYQYPNVIIYYKTLSPAT